VCMNGIEGMTNTAGLSCVRVGIPQGGQFVAQAHLDSGIAQPPTLTPTPLGDPPCP